MINQTDANLPCSLSMNVAFGSPSVSAPSVTGARGNRDKKMTLDRKIDGNNNLYTIGLSNYNFIF